MGRESRIALPAREGANLLRRFQQLALEVAAENIGRGEDPMLGNNRGPWVEKWRAGDAVDITRLHQQKVGGSGSWCAVFGSYCDAEAARRLGAELGCEFTLPHPTFRGAKALARSPAKYGGGRYLAHRANEKKPLRFFDAKGEPIPLELLVITPGAWIAWHRGDVGAWTGHFARALEYNRSTGRLTTIEGNKNNRPRGGEKPPARARMTRWSEVDSFTYPRDKWLARLAWIATYC